MTDFLSPSRIARLGLGLKPHSDKMAPNDTSCMACGAPISVGDPVFAWKPIKGTFTDFHYLSRPTKTVCMDCQPFLENQVLQKTQKCVISESGAWSLSKDSHRVWLLTDPPKPPFVAVISDSMKQHLIWRAMPTVDRDALSIQLGRQSLRIDRPLALEAMTWCRAIVDVARDEGVKVTPNHPFQRLDREAMDLAHGLMRDDLYALAMDHDDLKKPLAGLMALGPGELWALAILAKSKPVEPLAEPFSV